MRNLTWIVPCALCAALAGCSPSTLAPSGGDTTGGASAVTLSGTIVTPQDAKFAPRAQQQELHYTVVAQSTATQEVYLAETDANGAFELKLPEAQDGEAFMISIMQPNGQPGGPILFDSEGQTGYPSLTPTADGSLGTINFPADPSLAPIQPGADATVGVGDDVSDAAVVRLGDDGVPVGMATFGRGDDALVSSDPAFAGDQGCDGDKDGLIDMFDADDDGDGSIDDFDDDHQDPWASEGVIVNFFMNLKIDDVKAGAFFSGDVAGIEAILKNDTVITFEVGADASLGKTITAARIIGPPAPAPYYMSTMEVDPTGTGTWVNWSTTSYALRPDGPSHFQEWAVPHDFMNTGDTFTVEITYDDGTTSVHSRMINYVFKSIPKLENVGAPGATAPYNGPGEVLFDGTQDLVLEWAPPVDDFGVLMTHLPYQMEMFYFDASNAQIRDIDGAATWSTVPLGFDTTRQVLEVTAAMLGPISAQNTFTFTMPKEIFPSTVQTASGPAAVSWYKLDIAAQSNGNNAALMVPLRKQ